MRASAVGLTVPALAPILVVQFVFDAHPARLAAANDRGAPIAAVLRDVIERPLVAAEREWTRTMRRPGIEPVDSGDAWPPTIGIRQDDLIRRRWRDRLTTRLLQSLLRPLDRPWSLSGPHPPFRDLRLLASAGADPTDALAALDRVVERIPWSPRNPTVRRALRRRGRAEGRDVEHVKREELRAAVYLALGERGHPQVHRFGSRWLTDRRGHQRMFVPEDLPGPLFWRWFQDKVRSIAEASLGDQSCPWTPTERAIANPALVSSDTSSTRVQQNDPFGDEAPLPTDARLADLGAMERDPLDVLIEWEGRREVTQRWNELLRQATPRQRDILRVLVEADAASSSVTLADAARSLNLAPSTVRVQWKRLLDRAHAHDR